MADSYDISSSPVPLFVQWDDAAPIRVRLARALSSARLMFAYTYSVLRHERQRFLAAVVAVCFSCVLIVLQWGLVLGIYSATSLPIDRTRAHIWMGAPETPTVDRGQRMSDIHRTRLASQPEVLETELLVLDYGYWVKPSGSKETCLILGSELHEGALGAVRELTLEMRSRLTELGSVVVDEADRERLGFRGVDDTAEVVGKRVRIVGVVRGLKGLNVPYVFCSLETARELLNCLPDQTTFILARCNNEAEATRVVRRLQRYSDVSVRTAPAFSRQTQMHWLFGTPGGVATTFMAALALFIGAMVTNQTLYSATIASLREYAILRALGISRRRIGTFVLSESLGVGGIGICLAFPAIFLLGELAAILVGTRLQLPWWLLVSVPALTLLVSMLSGVATLRSLRLMDPIALLH